MRVRINDISNFIDTINDFSIRNSRYQFLALNDHFLSKPHVAFEILARFSMNGEYYINKVKPELRNTCARFLGSLYDTAMIMDVNSSSDYDALTSVIKDEQYETEELKFDDTSPVDNTLDELSKLLMAFSIISRDLSTITMDSEASVRRIITKTSDSFFGDEVSEWWELSESIYLGLNDVYIEDSYTISEIVTLCKEIVKLDFIDPLISSSAKVERVSEAREWLDDLLVKIREGTHGLMVDLIMFDTDNDDVDDLACMILIYLEEVAIRLAFRMFSKIIFKLALKGSNKFENTRGVNLLMASTLLYTKTNTLNGCTEHIKIKDVLQEVSDESL